MKGVLTLLLAGGKGERLEPLTRDRTKPAVPFGGGYRIIDFTLSNCINSGLRRILVLTQYKAASLNRHINLAWRFLHRELDEYIDVLPPQQRVDENWYRGTADAVYQNIYSIEQANPEHIVILSGDHIYKMDYSEMIRVHLDTNADATIGCIPVPVEEGRQFGVMQINDAGRIVDFEEKPPEPKPSPSDPNRCLASMGIYVFKARFLFDQLCDDATHTDSAHDFGKNIIPSITHTHRVQSFEFRDKNTGSGGYWRDVGTLEAYYEANMDLVSVEPELNMYDRTWPIRGEHSSEPPPKFVFGYTDGPEPRAGMALDSLVCGGSIISGGRVERSVLSPNVRVHSWANVQDSILFEGVEIMRHAKVRNAIIDKEVVVPEGMEIGYDLELDRQRGFTVTPSGLVAIAKGDGFSTLWNPGAVSEVKENRAAG
ncbi:MAG: glucose-1-phosphate adenylyltransferase [Planctomycetota bacterium]|nr:glucose-1-phosphate adenylyltransferase [Planctomycetota bacterium]